ncbi:MAG: Uma2 family endonuclease [Gammaproteobacteria bacterium]|nr:Uma2 family endonuclease [Gammaproteobacteria bacterium]
MESTACAEQDTGLARIMGSRNHSYVQAKLIVALDKLGKHLILPELTLDIQGKEPVPDVCLYPEQKVNLFEKDMLKMQEMPLLAIEILSPHQGIQDILEKFELYFAAGIRSCWLVIPNAKTVVIYASMTQARTFGTNEVHDKELDLRIPIMEIFG